MNRDLDQECQGKCAYRVAYQAETCGDRQGKNEGLHTNQQSHAKHDLNYLRRAERMPRVRSRSLVF